MFRRSFMRKPRAEYRPLTAYEEFFGYSGAKRNANVLMVIGVGLFFTLMKLMIQMNWRDPNQAPLSTPTELDLHAELNRKEVLNERERLVIELAKREKERRMYRLTSGGGGGGGDY